MMTKGKEAALKNVSNFTGHHRNGNLASVMVP